MHAEMKKMKMKMKMVGVSHPGFIQPLIPGFLHHFSIPVSYLKHMEMKLEGHPLESVVLIAYDQPLRHWVVNVTGGRHFKDGWEEFCVHHHLQVGDFIVFTHESHFVFHVSVFDPFTACHLRFSSSQSLTPYPYPKGVSITTGFNSSRKRKRKKSEGEGEGATEIPTEQAQFLSCYVTITAYSAKRSSVYLPRGFMRSSGLAKRSCYIKLIDEKAIPWQVKLCNRPDGQPYISYGWKDFQIANNIGPGSVVRFQLIEAGRIPILKCLVSRVSRASKP